MVWEGDGFDFGSTEVAGRPICAGECVSEGIHILAHDDASSVGQFSKPPCGRGSDG